MKNMNRERGGGGGLGGNIFVFVLTKTKLNDNTQSGLHLEKIRKLALLVKSIIMHAKIR